METNKRFKLTVEEYFSLSSVLSWYRDNKDTFNKMGWDDLDLYDIIDLVVNDCEIYNDTDTEQVSKKDGDFDWDNLIQEIQDGNI